VKYCSFVHLENRIVQEKYTPKCLPNYSSSKEVTISESAEWVRRPAAHPSAPRVPTTATASESRSHRIKPGSWWDLRVVATAASRSLTGEHRIVESRVHAAATHSTAVAGSDTAAERIVGSEALRVQVSVADAREAGSGQTAACWALCLEFVFEAWHGLGHWAARVCERVGERVGSGWIGVAIIAEGVSLRSVGVRVVGVVVVICLAGF
jgi:hypothetical protein